jgi:hypothetical protein
VVSAATALVGGDHAVITANADAVVEGFPEPPGTFRLRDLPQWALSVFRQLHARDLVVATATRVDPAIQSHYTDWQVDRDAWAYAKDIREKRTPLCPCGHAGIDNHGDHYECGFVGCDAVFSRSDLKVSK